MTSSVVIATYNGQRFILEQLESIISQTVLPTEIIISDDGSTDNTKNIINAFIADHYDLPVSIMLITNDSGEHGVVSNFENAVKHATGEYIFFCDQDDIWLESKVERMIHVLQQTQAKVAFHNARILKEENGTFSLTDDSVMAEYSFDESGVYIIDGPQGVFGSLYYRVIPGMCICVKRSYLLSIMPFSRGALHDGWILFCAHADDSLVAVREELCFYRIHSSNTVGVKKYRTKRSLKKRVQSFDQEGKKSIINQYVWFSDVTDYLNGRFSDERINKMVNFYVGSRIRILSEMKLPATVHLLTYYRAGAYRKEGPIVLLHDLFFLWRYTRTERKQFLMKKEEGTRHKTDE